MLITSRRLAPTLTSLALLVAAGCGSDSDSDSAASNETAESVARAFFESKSCEEAKELITDIEDLVYNGCDNLESDYLNASDCTLIEQSEEKDWRDFDGVGPDDPRPPVTYKTYTSVDFECINNNKSPANREEYGAYVTKIDGEWKVFDANS